MGLVGFLFLMYLRHLQKGANKSPTVTKTSSLGMWVPVHDDEWDGDIPLGLERPDSPTRDMGSEPGEVTFNGDRLPWVAGLYEVRPHFWLTKRMLLMNTTILVEVSS